MNADPYEIQVEKLECIGLSQKCMGTRLLDLKRETEKKNDAKSLSGHNRDSLTYYIRIQRYYSMAIRNNINELHSMKTAVRDAYFHPLSSNEGPQHVLYPAIINTWCKFQKTEAECNKRHYDHK
ncbi:uncharacterized protein TNCV_2768921 [Trichonephila clavipes]|nr:uncharacterized protein TNCV_2768921 [Trichonephila clavipes]